jgi:uncharacterized cupin superfamily protein
MTLERRSGVRVSVVSLDRSSAAENGYLDWPTWERGISRFAWHYDTNEQCYLIQGKAVIETDDGNVEIEAGDFVTFPSGLDCVWDIREPVSKHYQLEPDA